MQVSFSNSIAITNVWNIDNKNEKFLVSFASQKMKISSRKLQMKVKETISHYKNLTMQ